MHQVKLNNEAFIRLIEEAFIINQKAIFKVTGHSMRPFFKHEKTYVTLIKKKTYQRMDIILFKYENAYVLHRIIHMKDDQMICQGDALMRKEVIQKEQIIGAVVSFSNGKKSTDVKNMAYKIQVNIWLVIKPCVVRILKR